MNAGEVIAVHGPNDCFDNSLLVERQSRHAFIVEEEAICYLLPVDELIDLTANNKAFAEFFFRDISLKLDALAARQTIRELQPVMMAQVRDAYIHPPLYVDTATSAYEAGAPDERARPPRSWCAIATGSASSRASICASSSSCSASRWKLRRRGRDL